MSEHPVIGYRILSEEEATEVQRPERGPWLWAGPILACVSDSWKWQDWPEWHPHHGPLHWRIAQSAIENLYGAGYAIVRLEGVESGGSVVREESADA